MQNSLPEQSLGGRRNKAENRNLRFVCWILVLLAMFRGVTVGTDTVYYWREYLNMPDMSIADVMEQFGDFPGFYLLAKTCSLLHLPIQILFGLVEGLYVFAIYKFINRFSSDKLYSILGFTVIGLFSFSMAGLKQTMSMAFALLCYMSLYDKRYIGAIVFAVAAYFCHHVSLIFLSGIALYYLRNLRFYYVFLVLIVIIVLLGTNYLWSGLLSLLENDHYSELYKADEGYSSTTMQIYGVLLIILFLFSGRYRQLLKEDSRIMFGMSILAFTFQAFSFVSSSAFRLSLFFLPFMVVAFPNDFNCIRDADTRRWVKISVELILIFIFIYTNRNGGSVVPYRFFWQT